MTAQYTGTVAQPTRFLIFCWLLVGSLDIVMAFIDFYVSTGQMPFIVLRYIARGVFRQTALSGNAVMYLWGLIFHYFIALCFTLFFFVLYRRLQLINRNTVLVAVFFGLLIFAMMNIIVLPLVFHKPWHFKGFISIKAAMILIAAFGLPLSYLFRRYFLTHQTVSSNKVIHTVDFEQSLP